MALLTIIVGATLLIGNEATVSNVNLEAYISSTEIQLKAEVAQKAAAMPIDNAIEILRSMNKTSPGLMSLVQDEIGGHHKHHHRLKHSKKAQQKAGPDANADYSSGLKNAMVRLNEMMLETIMHMDAVDLECRQFSRTQQYYITELEQDSQYSSQQVTLGNAGVLDARAQKASYEGKIPIAEAELKAHNFECLTEQTELNRQLSIAKSDAEVMDKILNMTQCNDVAYEKADKVALLQCVDKRTGKHYTKMQATDPDLKKEIAKLQHPKSVSAMTSELVSNSHAAFVQTRLRRGRVDPLGLPPPPETAGDNFEYGVVVLNATADPNLEQGAEECSLSNSSKCPELRERFVNIAGGVQDAIEELESMIENKQLRCSQIREDLNSELEHYGYWFKEWETRLATAVANTGEMRTAFKNKQSELLNARALYDAKMTECHKSLTDSKSELCALTKIRGELATMSAWDNEISDCEVSEWDVPSCPVTCGGSTQTLTRITEMQPGAGTEAWEKGHECPLLVATQSCNEFRCPTDCMLADWQEWSRCTVTCGGGVSERLRSVDVHPTPLGVPCEATLESVQCNAGPCDVDCGLSEWTEWSQSCTKMCGEGQSTRIKTLEATEIGDGTCATFYDHTRFQARPCNTQPCSYLSSVGRCVAKMDVILLIDGSGSLGTKGWEAVKTATTRIVGAMGGEMNVGVLLFSGPPDTCMRKRCLNQNLGADCRGQGWTTNSAVTPQECGMNWVSRLSGDHKTVMDGVGAMQWPAQVSLHSIALKSAQLELINSRKGAPSVVLLITDGYPYSKKHTRQNADALKDAGARVMMLPIGQDAASNEDFANWVSFPSKDNLVPVESFDDLSNNYTLNHALTDFCTQFLP